MSRTFPISRRRRAALGRISLLALPSAIVLVACSTDAPTAVQSVAPSAALVMPPCVVPTRGKPDLIAQITSIVAGGVIPPYAGWGSWGNGEREVHVTGYVKNIGTACAATFRIGARQDGYLSAGDAIKIVFADTSTVSSQGFTKAPLAPGSKVAFSATMSALIAAPDGFVKVRLEADACGSYLDAKVLSTYCRVMELLETNNLSRWAVMPQS